MEITHQNNLNLQKLKEIQISFEQSIKILERHVAESIANKKELEIIKKDLLEASKKFHKASNHLNDLKNSINSENNKNFFE
jgi:hypothetical protein